MDETAVDRRTVGLRRQRCPLERIGQALLDVLNFGDRLLVRALTGTDRHHARALWLRRRQREPAGLEQFEPLVAEPDGVHRYFVSKPCASTSSGRCTPFCPRVARRRSFWPRR